MSASNTVTLVVIALMIGVAIGWTWGTTMEHKLWLDAIFGREKIARGKFDERE